MANILIFSSAWKMLTVLIFNYHFYVVEDIVCGFNLIYFFTGLLKVF